MRETLQNTYRLISTGSYEVLPLVLANTTKITYRNLGHKSHI